MVQLVNLGLDSGDVRAVVWIVVICQNDILLFGLMQFIQQPGERRVAVTVGRTSLSLSVL